MPLVYEESDKLFQLLVDTFGLAICLWVVGGRGCQPYADEAIKFAGEVRYKLRAAVRNHNVRGAVVFPDLAKEEASRSYCCDGVCVAIKCARFVTPSTTFIIAS